MKLYICGNGFDVHNGFKTEYKHYRDYLLNGYRWDSSYRDIVDTLEKYSYTSFQNIDSWSDVEKNLTLDYHKYVRDFCELFNWTRDVGSLYNPSKEYKELLIQFRVGDFSKNISSFTGECFYDWIISKYTERLSMNKKCTKETSFLRHNCEDLFITFNYTTTLQDLYEIPSTNVLPIHGCVTDIDGDQLRIPEEHGTFIQSHLVRWNLQFGSIKNEPKKIKTELDKLIIEPKNEMFSKKNLIDNIINYCQSSYKDISSNYERVSKFIKNKQITEIIIMGHSISGVDKPYYTDILVPKFKNCKWTLYYYKNKDDANKFIEEHLLEMKNCNLIKW